MCIERYSLKSSQQVYTMCICMHVEMVVEACTLALCTDSVVIGFHAKCVKT